MENNKEVVKPVESNDDNKVNKAYDATMKKLVAIVGGDENLFPVKKVKKDVVKSIVSGLIKERKENAEKDVTKELVDLLDKHIQLKKALADKKKELDNLEQQKKKEFNEAASKLFGKIDEINQLESEYYSSLNTMVSGKE